MTVAVRHLPDADERLHALPLTRPIRIEVLHEVGAAARFWREIEAAGGIVSPYQRYDWVRLWQTHVGAPAGETPCIVVGFDAGDRALFLWPLLQSRLGPLKIATFFGGKHATLNVPLWRPDAMRALTLADMQAVLADLARQARGLDLLLLAHQPAQWRGLPNPLLLLPHQRSADDNFVLRLGGTGAEVIARTLSSNARSRLRYLERKLGALAGYRQIRAESAEDVERLLETFYAQKAAKLAALGLKDVFAAPQVKDFIRAACLCGLAEGAPLMELHALEGDGEMLALFSGMHDGERFTCAFTSHTATVHGRQSPGLVLLHRLVLACSERGFGSFDVGPGEARYKAVFCKELEPIYDSILPLSAYGRMAAPALRALMGLKARIKRDPRLRHKAVALRAGLNRLRGREGQAAEE